MRSDDFNSSCTFLLDTTSLLLFLGFDLALNLNSIRY